MAATNTANGLLQKQDYNDPLWQVILNQNLDNIDTSLSSHNYLDNPFFDVCQRTLGANADDTYASDRWYVLTQTASVAASLGTEPEDGFIHYMRLTQSQASAQRFGFAQIVEGLNCKHLRGKNATLSGRVRCSASTTLRYAILGWSGTEDTVTSDWVNSWTNGTFTAGNFFTSTSTVVLGTGSIALTAATWTSITKLTAAMGSAFKNLAVMFWTDSTQAQNVTLDVSHVKLEEGSYVSAPYRKSYAIELEKCKRYYEQREAVGAFQFFGLGIYANAVSTTEFYVSILGITEKRITPTLTYSANADFIINAPGGGYNITAMSLTNGYIKNCGLLIVTSASAVAVGASGLLEGANSTAARIYWNAEL